MRFISLLRALVLFAGLGVSSACDGERGPAPRFDSNTNWLRACDTDSPCPAPLACVCGQCTAACSTRGCPDGLVCSAPERVAAAAECEAPAEPVCAALCSAFSPCPDLSQSCVLGLCVASGPRTSAPPASSATEVDAPSDGSTAREPADAGEPTAPDPFASNAAPVDDLDASGRVVLEPLVSDAEIAPDAAPISLWLPPGRAVLRTCEGRPPYTSCAAARLADGGSSPRVTTDTVDFAEGGLVYHIPDDHSLSLGIGSWTFDGTALSFQLETPATEVGLTVGAYEGRRAPSGCFDGALNDIFSSTPAQLSFVVCGP